MGDITERKLHLSKYKQVQPADDVSDGSSLKSIERRSDLAFSGSLASVLKIASSAQSLTRTHLLRTDHLVCGKRESGLDQE